MATSKRTLDGSIILPLYVETGQTASKGCGVLYASDTTVSTAGAGSDLCIGIALHDATAGKPVAVLIQGMTGVKVGAGGATRGKKAVILNDGKFEDAPAHDSSGGTDNAIYGVFQQSGVNGDIVGMLFIPCNRGSA